MRTLAPVLLIVVAIVLAPTGCSMDTSPVGPRETGTPSIETTALDHHEWSDRIDNPFLPLTPGKVFTYRGQKDGDPEIDRIHVTRQTKTILGVVTTVVQDSVYVNGTLEEATLDWYAQDEEGDVWYFGEDSKEFDAQGHVISTEGSWEAGVNGARAGIVMEADPETGDRYYQEFLQGVAEDQAMVLSLNASANVPYGHFHHCLKTKEWTRLEPGVVENKFYARDVGFLQSVMVRGGNDFSKLVSVVYE